MQKAELYFQPPMYKALDGTERIANLNDDTRIALMIKELMDIYQREQKRPEGYNDLPYGSDEYLLNAIGELEKAIEWPEDIEDSYGEPPITMAEMHTAAWKEHQAMHS